MALAGVILVGMYRRSTPATAVTIALLLLLVGCLAPLSVGAHDLVGADVLLWDLVRSSWVGQVAGLGVIIMLGVVAWAVVEAWWGRRKRATAWSAAGALLALAATLLVPRPRVAWASNPPVMVETTFGPGTWCWAAACLALAVAAFIFLVSPSQWSEPVSLDASARTASTSSRPPSTRKS